MRGKINDLKERFSKEIIEAEESPNEFFKIGKRLMAICNCLYELCEILECEEKPDIKDNDFIPLCSSDT